MLVDARGRPIDAQPATAAAGDVVYQEIATIGGGRDITRPFTQEILDPLSDHLLADRQVTLATYRRLLTDWQVQSTLQQRRTALISREWEVVPGGKRAMDRAAADWLKEQLQQLTREATTATPDPRAPAGWDAKVARMHYGVFYGYAVGEMVYARDGRHVAIDDIRVRDRERFRFGSDGTLRLLTTDRMVEGEVMPPRKFWTFSSGADHDDDPYGVGLAHFLYWPVFFKRNGIAYWLKFLERFASPTPYGKYAPGTGLPEQRKLLMTLRALQHDAGFIYPDGMEVGLMEAQRSATPEYAALTDRMDSAIAKVNLSQTMTTDDGSSRSQAEVHEDVAEAVQMSDNALVMGSFNAGPATWLTEWNFPGAKPPAVWYVFDEPEDLTALAERDRTLHGIGWQRTEGSQREIYGEGYERKQPAAPAPAGARGALPVNGAAAAALAEAGDETDTAATLADQLDQAQPVDALMAPIEQLLAGAGSLEEFRDGLLEAYATMDAATLGEALQRALVTAELAGRYEVNQDTDGQ